MKKYHRDVSQFVIAAISFCVCSLSLSGTIFFLYTHWINEKLLLAWNVFFCIWIADQIYLCFPVFMLHLIKSLDTIKITKDAICVFRFGREIQCLQWEQIQEIGMRRTDTSADRQTGERSFSAYLYFASKTLSDQERAYIGPFYRSDAKKPYLIAMNAINSTWRESEIQLAPGLLSPILQYDPACINWKRDIQNSPCVVWRQNKTYRYSIQQFKKITGNKLMYSSDFAVTFLLWILGFIMFAVYVV